MNNDLNSACSSHKSTASEDLEDRAQAILTTFMMIYFYDDLLLQNSKVWNDMRVNK